VKRQLVIHENRDVLEEASKAVERALGKQAEVIQQSNFERALKLLSDTEMSWSMIVLGSTTPATAASSGSPVSSSAACEFMRTFRKSSKTPVIVLAVNQEPALTELLKRWEDNTAVVQYDWTLLEQRVRELQYSIPMQSSLELEIRLDDSDQGAYTVQRIGGGYLKSGSLLIKRNDFDQLVNTSELVSAAGTKWKDFLTEVGRQLNSMLFENFTNDLTSHFFGQRVEVGGTQNVRILFTLGRTRQRALVEALREKQEASDFWMLKAPIVRQYNVVGEKRPLFMDDVSRRGNINCLVINANPARGRVNGTDLEDLPEIANEAAAIQRILQAARERGEGIGEIERLDLAERRDDSVGTVIATLKRTPWHMIHFAGHSIMAPSGAPTLVLDAALGEVLPFATMAIQLCQTQFLFVSTCKGADQAILTRAIENVIPAVLGFRWRVEDLPARQFAEAFYSCLFTRGDSAFKSLEYACLAARRAAYERDPENNTWASPLLLTQMRGTN
jgi:hypothetical protein